MTAYLALFLTSLLAATVLPFYSEVMLVGLVGESRSSVLLVIVATAGNTAGAVINWLLGIYLLEYQDRRWFPFKPQQVERAQSYFQRYGVWTLLFSWLPIGGDALTFIAGILKVKFWVFLVLVAIGKLARYAVVVYLTVRLQSN